MLFYLFVGHEQSYNNCAKDLFGHFFLVASESSMYQTMMAAKPLMPKKSSNGTQTSKKIKLTLLSFHDRFLNFNENIGISATNSQANRQTNKNR